MASVKGFVEKIKYRNEENGYTVLSLTGSDDGEEYILVGNFSFIGEGELLEASGHMTEHPVYGEQLSVESYEIKPPEDTVSMERYLGSGAIKGIGAALASRIVKKFKKDTFRIMEEEPERLAVHRGADRGKAGYAPGHDVPSGLRRVHESGGENLPGIRPGHVRDY